MSHPSQQNYLSMEEEKVSNYNPEYTEEFPQDTSADTTQTPATVPYPEYQAMQQRFLDERKKMEDQMWLDQTLISYDEMLREHARENVADFSEIILNHLAKLINAVYGAFFMVDTEQGLVNAVAGYACTVETMARTQFKIGEGLIGQVAKSKEIICLENIEAQLDSSLGRISSTTLMIAPLVIDGQIIGIIELNSLSKSQKRIITLLEKISKHTALSLRSILYPIENTSAIDTSKYDELIAQLQEKETELENLKVALEEKEQALEIPSTLEKATHEALLQVQLDHLQEQLKGKEQQLNLIQEQLSAAQTGQEIVARSSDEENEKIIEMGQELAKTQAELIQTQVDLSQKESDWQEAQERLAQVLMQGNEEQVGLWEQKIAEAEEQIQELSTRNDELFLEIQRRMNDYEMLKETIKWKDAEIDRQDEAILEKKKILQNAEKEIEALMQENLRNVEEIVRQDKALKSREEEVEGLISQLEQATANEEIEQLNQIITQKSEEVEILKNEISETRQSLEQRTNKLAELEELILQKNGEIKQLQALIQTNQEQLEIQNEQIKTTLGKLRKKEDELLVSQYLLNQQQGTGENAELVLSLKNQVKEREEEIKQLQVKIEEKEQHFQVKQDELQAHLEAQNNTNIDTLYAEIESLQSQINQQGKNEDTTNLQDEITELRTDISQKNTEITSLKEQLESQKFIFEDNDLGSLQEKLNEKENEIRLIKEGNQLQVEALEILKNELFSREQAPEKFVNQSESQASSEELEQALEELHRKEHELLQQTEALSNLRTQLLEKEKTIEHLKRQPEANPNISQEDLEAFNQKLDDMEVINQDLKIKEHEITSQTEVIHNQKIEILEKHQQLEILREKIKIKEQENLKQDAKIQSQQEQLLARQEELNQKEKELIGLFNKINSAFAALEFDMSGKILSINNKFLMLLGRKVQEVEGQSLSQLLPEEFTKSMDYILLWEGLKMGVTQTVDRFICLGNKEREIVMSVTFIPIIDKNGKPYEIVQLVNQIYEVAKEEATEIKREGIQQEVQNSDQLQRLKALDMAFIVMELDLQGNVLEVNHNFSIHLGYDEKEVVGKHHREFLDITERTSTNYENIINKLAGGGYSSEIFKYLGKEGERVRFRSHFHPIMDESENPIKSLVISQLVN